MLYDKIKVKTEYSYVFEDGKRVNWVKIMKILLLYYYLFCKKKNVIIKTQLLIATAKD